MWTWRASDGQLLYRSPVSAGYCSQSAMTAGMAFALTAGNGHTLPGLRQHHGLRRPGLSQ